MALKNHALDPEILRAARAEFSRKGYEAASLRAIAAAAGVTVGAIYTRYPTKDALFCALVAPLTEEIAGAFQSLRASYYREGRLPGPEHLARVMEEESQTILRLLFENYDRALLLLCRSAGSSMEGFFDSLVSRKAEETLAFFRASGLPHPPEGLMTLLIRGQFQMYAQILREGWSLEEARALLRGAMLYHTGGWLALLSSRENQEETEHEV